MIQWLETIVSKRMTWFMSYKMFHHQASIERNVKNLLEELANETKSRHLVATDLIHLEENYSGTHVNAQLRKNLNRLMSTHKEVKAQK